jgi:alkylation response protein AidB-like acyl-CoA dehydrogenase
MDLSFTPEEIAFREEVRAFLRENVAPDRLPGLQSDAEDHERVVAFRKKVAEKGWLRLGWPERYGGIPATPIQQFLFAYEFSYHHAMTATFATQVVAPGLLHFGNEEQRQRFLPAIGRGEIDFCLGYTEPGAGSDLASLQTRAVRDGDDYVITGQKLYTSNAHHAEWCWLAARTDPTAPKHKGISVFLVDMRSPGIEVRPLETLDGHRTNITFWDNVRVPKENLVGEENRGWYYVAGALDLERAALFPWGGIRRDFDDLLDLARQLGRLPESTDGILRRGGGPGLDDGLRVAFARCYAEMEAMWWLSCRAAAMIAVGEIPTIEASMVKCFGTEAHQRVARIGHELLGIQAILRPGAPQAPLRGLVNYMRRYAFMPTFAGGTNEIQRTIIATRGLGLPAFGKPRSPAGAGSAAGS